MGERTRCGVPQRPTRDVLALLLRHAPMEELAERHPDDHPRRGVLLRPAGDDQSHERGVAVYWHSKLMTQHFVQASEDRAVRRPSTRACWPCRPAASTRTRSRRDLQGHRAPLDAGKHGATWERMEGWARRRSTTTTPCAAAKRSSRFGASTTTCSSSTSFSRPSSSSATRCTSTGAIRRAGTEDRQPRL